MSIVISDIDFDKEATSFYRDKYNDQCRCRECILFRNKFSKNYPMIDTFLSDLGINIHYPLEIMDNGISSVNLKRNYSVYYSVKGMLPYDKIEDTIQGVSVILRNWNIANESYSNTGMIPPYFIIELTDIFISDNE